MNLRDYQKECINKINSIDKGNYLIQMATGLGKTVTFANIQRKGRVLLLSHREELVTQPQKYYDCSFGIEQGKNHSTNEEVVSASVQSIVKRLDNFNPNDFDMIICDEAHHAAANTDYHVTVFLLEFLESTKITEKMPVGILSYGARVEDYHVSCVKFAALGRGKSHFRQHAREFL